MLALVVVIVHKLDDLPLQLFGRIVVLQVHHMLHQAVVAFDLVLGHRVVVCAVGVFNMPAVQVILQILGKVTGSVVGKQAGTQKHIHPIHPCFPYSDLQGLLYIRRVHAGCKLPGQNAAGVIIQDRGEVVPTSAQDLEVGKVRLQNFVHSFGGILEFVFGANHSKYRTFHQITSS